MKPTQVLGSILGLLTLAGLISAQGRLERSPPDRPDPPAAPPSGGESRFNRPPPPPELVGGRSLDSWMQQLTYQDASKRASAIVNLVAFRENASSNPRCIAALLARLHDSDTSPRVKAIIAFRYLPALGNRNGLLVVEELARLLKFDTQTVVRYEAAITLNHFAGQNREAIPALVHGATRDNGTWEIRLACVDALRGAGWDARRGPDPEATQALLQATKDGTHEVRLHALMNLGFMGRPRDPRLLGEVVSALDVWSTSPTADRTSVLWANVSLVLLGAELKERALDAIARYLTLRERDLRIQGIQALGVLGENARSKVPDLVNMLSDSEETVIVAAVQALAMMHDSSERVLRPLIGLTRLKKDQAALIWQACMSLGQIGSSAPEVVRALEDVNQREGLPRELRYAADAALKELRKAKRKAAEAPDEQKRPALELPVGR